MNIHYKNYPTDFIDRLQGQGKRHKARCFWEYYNDVQCKAVNSITFYMESWSQTSRGSTHKWVKEFRDEIQRFYDAHLLLNKQHYSSVQKQSEQKVNTLGTLDELQTPDIPTFENLEGTPSEHQVKQVLNINNNNNNARGLYDGFYFIYRQFNSYAGSKWGGLDAFMRVNDVAHKSLSIAAILYLKDDRVEKKVGVKKFLDNQVYLNYLDLHLSVFFEGRWMDGVYDTETGVFETSGQKYAMSAEKLAEKFGKDEIKFLKEVA